MRTANLVIFIALVGTARAQRAIEIDEAMERGAKQHPQAREDAAIVRAADARTDVEPEDAGVGH